MDLVQLKIKSSTPPAGCTTRLPCPMHSHRPSRHTCLPAHRTYSLTLKLRPQVLNSSPRPHLYRTACPLRSTYHAECTRIIPPARLPTYCTCPFVHARLPAHCPSSACLPAASSRRKSDSKAASCPPHLSARLPHLPFRLRPLTYSTAACPSAVCPSAACPPAACSPPEVRLHIAPVCPPTAIRLMPARHTPARRKCPSQV
ncbi:hypothetical protein GGX14DRAFT_572728 [Mycena pura]|uniref:Uncharacterized protein n=1 Tax=Mycena pura TaxID=153505 RepID=A0AAD6V4L5_9AGAR|nr:hypothetical protein GGX14DRAFT_572728 [Mycena pura]